MNEKINKSKEIIIDRIYAILTSNKEISADTFIGISNIVIELDKKENKIKNEKEELI